MGLFYFVLDLARTRFGVAVVRVEQLARRSLLRAHANGNSRARSPEAPSLPSQTKALCEKWFENIEKPGETNKNIYVKDIPQTERKFLETTDLSPNPAVFLVWRGPSYKEFGSLELDIFSDMLGGSEVSDLQQVLVKEKQISRIQKTLKIEFREIQKTLKIEYC